jgi:hypothetical protein
MTTEELMKNEELAEFVTEDLEDFEPSTEIGYAVWAIGYAADGTVTEADMLLGEFQNPDEAIAKAKSVTLAEVVHQAAEEYDGREPEDVAYISIEVETVVDCEEGTMNVGTIFKKELPVFEEEPDEEESGEVVCIRTDEYTLREDGSIEVDCAILKNFNKNDNVQFMFIEENSDTTPILTYKIISKTTANKYICEFVY